MKILITGGAGFIGVHTAFHFSENHDVFVVDNLSRKGSDKNLEWLQRNKKIKFAKVDIRNASDFSKQVKEFRPDVVIHLAAQVAVTTSVEDPRNDFENNALGTLNVLEAIRLNASNSIVLYSSTNKVYGGMEDVEVKLQGNRYQYHDLPKGASEGRQLDFHSPYGCSKGAADQYVRDYSRIYGLNTVVFRQSCIYGTRQFGIEDQGWVAWFTICSVMGKPFTIYGDGKQVRDVLWVDDLVKVFESSIDRISQVKGEVFNIGGGPTKQMSLLELVSYLEEIGGKKLNYSFGNWRPGDQKVFVADVSRAEKFLNWKPLTEPKGGVIKLYNWVNENKALFQ